METTERHTPDILNCLANLSSDEVFTSPELANQMLDLLPQELFSSPKTTFLDPCCKSGVFLREIAKRLLKGLETQIPDLQKRIDHIMNKQLFGIALTRLTAEMGRRTLYCAKKADGEYSVATCFKNEQGNLRYLHCEHSWKNGKCSRCGANRAQYDRVATIENYAYPFIHKNLNEIFKNMQFDVIIGNPPYQLDDGGNSASSKPIYHLFVEQALKLNPNYLCMIIPARWYAGGKGLDDFRDKMLKDRHIAYLIDYANSADCFSGVIIAGGVCYFLWDRKHNDDCLVANNKSNSQGPYIKRKLSAYNFFVRDNKAVDIIEKIRKVENKYLDSIVLSRNCFSLPSNERGIIERNGNLVLLSSDGYSYIPRTAISDRNGILNKYKVIITYAMSGGNKPSADGKYQIISSLLVLNPKQVCTETYLVLNTFDKRQEADNMCSYVKTKFFRFLLLQALSSIHITKSTFLFVPLQDFSHSWTDEMLYKKYDLSKDEIAFIESMIRPME